MTAAGWLAASCLAGVALAAAQAPAQAPVVRDAVPRAAGAPATTSASPGLTPLPPLTEDAQRLLDQWKQAQAGIIDQLRFLQLTYRDAGHAEDAAAIAAQVRALQQRSSSGVAIADLVNEGLPNRDEPVTMSIFRNHAGETLSFAIRGRDDQPVWGTTTYTDVSGLETAAVHAGLLRAGQSGIVKVTPLPGQDRYDAANQNGVLSSASGRYDGSYRITSVALVKPVRSASLSSYRDLVGHSITMPAVGAVAGSVWGSDVYTDDSSAGAAAVHAGVLSPGEFAFLKVTLMPGQARNGVTSQSYERFDGSFRVERAPEPWIVQLPGGEDASRVVPMTSLRGRTGTSFVVQVVGSASGSVWGTDVYTDDSSIAAAAVHAGGSVTWTVTVSKFDGTFRIDRVNR